MQGDKSENNVLIKGDNQESHQKNQNIILNLRKAEKSGLLFTKQRTLRAMPSNQNISYNASHYGVDSRENSNMPRDVSLLATAEKEGKMDGPNYKLLQKAQLGLQKKEEGVTMLISQLWDSHLRSKIIGGLADKQNRFVKEKRREMRLKRMRTKEAMPLSKLASLQEEAWNFAQVSPSLSREPTILHLDSVGVSKLPLTFRDDHNLARMDSQLPYHQYISDSKKVWRFAGGLSNPPSWMELNQVEPSNLPIVEQIVEQEAPPKSVLETYRERIKRIINSKDQTRSSENVSVITGGAYEPQASRRRLQPLQESASALSKSKERLPGKETEQRSRLPQLDLAHRRQMSDTVLRMKKKGLRIEISNNHGIATANSSVDKPPTTTNKSTESLKGLRHHDAERIFQGKRAKDLETIIKIDLKKRIKNPFKRPSILEDLKLVLQKKHEIEEANRIDEPIIMA